MRFLYAVWLCCCWPEVLAGLLIGGVLQHVSAGHYLP
jgi:hypothetical protein